MNAWSDRSALMRALEAAERTREDAERTVQTIRAALRQFPVANPNLPYLPEDEAPLKKVAFEIGRTVDCVRRWTIKHKLGRKCAGQWLVSRRRLQAFMNSSEVA